MEQLFPLLLSAPAILLAIRRFWLQPGGFSPAERLAVPSSFVVILLRGEPANPLDFVIWLLYFVVYVVSLPDSLSPLRRFRRRLGISGSILAVPRRQRGLTA